MSGASASGPGRTPPREGPLQRYRSRLADEGVASSIGFLASLVVLTASISSAVYFLAEMGTFVERDDPGSLERAASRALETLAGTPGQPEDWDLDPSTMRRPGLLDAVARDRASYGKVLHLQQGTVTARDLAETLDLVDEGYSVHAVGTMLPAPLLDPPGSAGAAVARVSIFDAATPYDLDATSEASLAFLQDVNPELDTSVQDWSFAWAQHPAVGLGDVFAEHPWEVQYNLIPRLAGIAATYTNINNLGTPSGAAENTGWLRYTSGATEALRVINRWQVVENGGSTEQPPFPGGGAPPAGDHALTFGFRHPNANDEANGVGLWRSYPGHRTWAVIGPVDVAQADALELSFYHYLDIQSGVSTNDPVILFWDAADPDDDGPNWEALDTEPDCTGGDNIGWHHTNEDETQPDWLPATIDLCEALERSDGELWLSFYWNTYCDVGGVESDCTVFEGTQGKKTTWFVDDIEITRTVLGVEQIAYETDFEAPFDADGETLFLAQGVQYSQYTAAPKPILTFDYIEHFVDQGGGILALAPGLTGDWLATVGLEASMQAPTSPVVTLDRDAAIMTFPNRIPANNDSYVSNGVAWSKTAQSTYGSPTQQLTAVQEVDMADPPTSTFAVGRPRGATGGQVAAISYDLVTFADTKVRDDLVENAYASLLFMDVTFETSDIPRPEAGTRAIAAAHRTMLVPVTSDGQYQGTIDLVVYVWEVALKE